MLIIENLDTFGLGDALILATYDHQLLDDELDILQPIRETNGHSCMKLEPHASEWEAVQLCKTVMQHGYPNAWGARIPVAS